MFWRQIYLGKSFSKYKFNVSKINYENDILIYKIYILKNIFPNLFWKSIFKNLF